MQPLKEYSGYQFAFFRIAFGTYLFIHFACLIPWAGELFSDRGVLADPGLNLTHGLFPNLLAAFSPPWFAAVFTGILAALAIAFLLGWRRRLVAVLLWYGWACLFNRNNLISNPGIPYVGWLLLACVVIPSGEPLSLGKKSDGVWFLPRGIFFSAWFLLALGYSISGYAKWNSPSWADGTAMLHLLDNPLARDFWFCDVLRALPAALLKGLTWGALALEILFLPLCLWRYGRMIAWSAMVAMHLGILGVIDFADLTFGMLMVHLFTLDPRWFPPRTAQAGNPVVFFDGVCGLCNHSVDFILREDSTALFRFSPLQGKLAQEALRDRPGLAEELSSVVLKDGDRILTKVDAAIGVLERLGGFWRLAVVFKLVPRMIRNKAYDFVAKNRYRWFGKKETCRIPTPAERSLFID